jgi:succinate dehydrogenase / fumarate reductase flavoprotein subunit
VLELESMLEAADCLVTSGLAREESRGAHTRVDFPERDDGRWMRHSLAWHDGGQVRLDYQPVTVTTYQPQVRSY